MSGPPSSVVLDHDIISMFKKGSRVLEYACAYGRTAFELEASGHLVTAFDIDTVYIREASRRGIERGSSVEFIVADGRSLPFDDSEFEVCVMNAYLTMLTDNDSRTLSIDETFRVLEQGGYLYIGDFLQNWDSPIYRERYEEHMVLTGEKGTFIVTEDGSIDGKEMYRAHHHTEEELSELLYGKFDVVDHIKRTFISFHGNEVPGVVILARRK